MGVKEEFYNRIFGEALANLQKELDIASLQKKYRAYDKQILLIKILDVNMPPVLLQVVDGKIARQFYDESEGIVPNAKIIFRTLYGFLQVLKGEYTIDQIFSFEGCLMDEKGNYVKEVLWEGDWYRGSIILKDIMNTYLDKIREILYKEMKIMRYMIEAYARVKKPFAEEIPEEDEE